MTRIVKILTIIYLCIKASFCQGLTFHYDMIYFGMACMYFHFQYIHRFERVIYFKQLKLVREIQELTTFSEELQQ